MSPYNGDNDDDNADDDNDNEDEDNDNNYNDDDDDDNLLFGWIWHKCSVNYLFVFVYNVVLLSLLEISFFPVKSVYFSIL